MTTQDLDRLRSIKTLPSLLKYLREELGWPVEAEDPEDATFEYTPDELGIDPDNAAKIKEIRQLRPLTHDQPWGIFWINFEPKRLPIVLLRRLLSGLAIKRRASVKHLKHRAWHLDDLLFISAYGEEGERAVTFAHFSQNADKEKLPMLKVLGWDDQDTTLHLDYAHRSLVEKLCWDPEYEEKVDDWRQRWSEAFELRHREVIETSRELAIRLAELARRIRRRVNQIVDYESEQGSFRRLHKAFRESLIHDLDEDDFADTYAQTVTYGLLSARISDPKKAKGGDDFASHMRTSPFLRDLMGSLLGAGVKKDTGRRGIDFDELGLSEVTQLLDDANMEAVLRDFGDRNPQEDPVIHFYELFLKEYDPKKRMQRGVFYTPRPVVSFIVRSVDELLRTEFGLTDGLADVSTWGDLAEKHKGSLRIPDGISEHQPFVQILDPATGTGTFLVEAIDLIHKTMLAKWRGFGERKIALLWNEYVSRHLLPRIHGYELLMAPYAIAHLKIGLKLFETGYRFDSDERVRVYLTNTLEPASDLGQMKLAGILPALATEARAVNDIKRNQRFVVVIGNPPYSGISANNSEYATHLVDAYKLIDGDRLKEKKLWLQDDYVKFIRAAQMMIDSTGLGILGFITNHGYLDNPTFRGMRQSLLASFQLRKVVDLHGNAKKKEVAPEGGPDANVFDIQQGVAIGLFLRFLKKEVPSPIVYRGDVYGSREEKYKRLSDVSLSSLLTTEICPTSPFYFFAHQDQTYRTEYESMTLLSEAMQLHSVGVVTARDYLTIAFTPEEIWQRVKRFVGLKVKEAREIYKLREDVRDWKVSLAQADLKSEPLSKQHIKPILYRPFDTRFTYYTGVIKGFIGQPAAAIMSHMINGQNLGLMTTRKVEVGHFGHAICSNTMTESHSVSLKEVNYLFPLWLYPNNEDLSFSKEKQANYSPQFLNRFSKVLGIPLEGESNQPRTLKIEDIFRYTYALLHSPTYRQRYAEFLKVDFPRLPLIDNYGLFCDLALIGSELIDLHLMKSPKVNDHISSYIGPLNPEVEWVGWTNNTVLIRKPACQTGPSVASSAVGFRGVPEDVWKFQIGSYQVCEKWLKDRKGLRLSSEDIAHYQRIVVALAETIRLMRRIDKAVEKNGGWPGAFRS